MLVAHLRTRLERIDESLHELSYFANGDCSIDEYEMIFGSLIYTIVDGSQRCKDYIGRKEFADWLKKHPEILG